jgi:hypothetical protein
LENEASHDALGFNGSEERNTFTKKDIYFSLNIHLSFAVFE